MSGARLIVVNRTKHSDTKFGKANIIDHENGTNHSNQ